MKTKKKSQKNKKNQKSKKAVAKKKPVKKAAKPAPAPRYLTSKIKGLARQLSAYGIGVDDVKARARQLEQVLRDLRSRDFLKQPGIQVLVDRVTRKNVEKANQEALRLAEKMPRAKRKLSPRQTEKKERQFHAISERAGQQLGATVVQAIMKRVEEVRKTISGKSESGRRKVK